MMVKIVDKSDKKEVYGFLHFNNVGLNELQNKVCEIVDELEDLKHDWIVDELVERLPIEWDCRYQSTSMSVYI